MADVQVLGVVTGTDAPQVAYLDGYLPATPEVLAQAEPLPVTRVLRLAATCEEKKCCHFDGQACQLATRIVRMLDAVVDDLPACTIRKNCRWFQQEGRPACLRCPQIVTAAALGDGRLAQVAHPAHAVCSNGAMGNGGRR